MPTAPTVLRNLVSQLSPSAALERYDLATIALDELITAYETTYQQSATEQHTAPQAQLKLARWQRGSRAFIDQLRSLRNRIEIDHRIEISINPTGPITLFIGATPVIVSGPEIVTASLMEQRIIDRFCQLHECDQLLKHPLTTPPPPKPVAHGRWYLQQRQGGRYETADGLVFMFQTLTNREQKQRQCEAIASDLRRLVARLRQARQAGYRIEWDQLKISTLSDGQTERITLNQTGDYLKMDLYFVDKVKSLDPRLLSWAIKRVADKRSYLVIPDAETLLAKRPH